VKVESESCKIASSRVSVESQAGTDLGSVGP